MASTRLSKDLKEQITKRVLKHRFQEQKDKLQKHGAEVALKAYNDVFTKSQRELMETLPKGWLRTANCLSVQTNSGYVQLGFNGVFYVEHLVAKEEAVEKRFPADKLRGALKVYEAGHKLGEEINKLMEARESLGEEVSAARRQLTAALDSVTTLGKLKKQWPEIEPFCPVEYSDGRVQLPALQPSKLNELLNLPVEEAA